MVEQYWQRADGTPSTREHFLMALSDIQAILVKASYTLNTQESRISQVSVDVASDQAPPGSRQAVEVEEVSVHTEISLLHAYSVLLFKRYRTYCLSPFYSHGAGGF